MRPCPHPSVTSSTLLLLIPSLATALSIDCENVKVDEKHFNLKPLEGPHSIYQIREHFPSTSNTTITIDICRPLEKTKGVKKQEDCPNGSRVCAIERLSNPIENVKDVVQEAFPIAGEFSLSGHGGSLDPKWTDLSTSPSSADREKEGIRLEMNGAPKQQAIIEFICDASARDRRRNVAGLSAAEDDEGDGGSGDGKEGEEVDDGQGGILKLLSWKVVEDTKVLSLEWTTEYACEHAKEGGEKKSSSGHWGFFTWFIIIVFMAVAAYLIFGSWLNYTRYSARGWDLLPHSETLHDIPYMLKDWMRRVVNTVQGGGSRGGYSAV